MNNKGAFQLSLGLVVIVVFAVILLSLSIGFITDLMGRVTDITHKVTEQAQQEVMKQIEAGAVSVGLAAPDVTSWGRGQTGSYSLIIRNDNLVWGEDFTVDISLTQLGGALAQQTPPIVPSDPFGATGQTYTEFVATWLTYSHDEFLQPDERKAVPIIIKPPTNAPPGIYLFKVLVIDDVPSTYGSLTFAIEIV
ncbi:MAG: hypothetical protein ABIJ92_02845 [Candidatus Aenigmatarchaeota archaeon]